MSKKLPNHKRAPRGYRIVQWADGMFHLYKDGACLDEYARRRDAIVYADETARSAKGRWNMTECTWEYDSDLDTWETECGESFCLTNGTPSENGMIYCFHCGKKIQESAVEGEEVMP